MCVYPQPDKFVGIGHVEIGTSVLRWILGPEAMRAIDDVQTVEQEREFLQQQFSMYLKKCHTYPMTY